jgi:hypothetical protein
MGSPTSLPLGLPITGSNIKGCLIFVRILIIFFDIRITKFEVKALVSDGRVLAAGVASRYALECYLFLSEACWFLR